MADLADKTGLTAALSEAMASTKVRDRGHDRGRVLVDAAVLIADGGEAISDIAALGQQRGLFGVVASVSTLWRAFEVCLTLRDKLRVFSSRFGGLLVVVGFCVFGCRVLVLCGGSDACAGSWVGTNICKLGVWPDLLCGVSEVSS